MASSSTYVVHVEITTRRDEKFRERFKPWPGDGADQPVTLEERLAGFVEAQLGPVLRELAVVSATVVSVDGVQR